ncbi:MAG: glycosyltransferase family 4 protein [Acidobacteriota bacterium]
MPEIRELGRARLSTILRIVLLLVLLALLLPDIRSRFFSAGNRWLYVLALSFSLSGLATPLMRWLAQRVGAVDEPDGRWGRKIHDRPTALLGGVAIWLAVVGALFANDVWPAGLAAVLATASLLLLFSAVDDVRPIGSWTKLTVFVVSAALAVAAGARATIFPASTLGTTLNALLSFVWIIGIFNALNFLDGMDGLATGLSIVIATFTGLVAFETGQAALGWASAAIVGACLGFLPFNFRPRGRATIFLGDAGSNFLGFMLGSIALLGYWADANPLVAISNPLLVFSVLIYDMTYISAARIASGKVRSFFEWINYVGQDHLHHRLLAVLGSRPKAVIAILLMNGCLGLAALALRAAASGTALLLLLQAFLILVLITMLERRGKRLTAG